MNIFTDEVTKRQKTRAISRALVDDPVGIVSLRQHAISKGGLLMDGLRVSAWPKLLNVNVYDIPDKPGQLMLIIIIKDSHTQNLNKDVF